VGGYVDDGAGGMKGCEFNNPRKDNLADPTLAIKEGKMLMWWRPPEVRRSTALSSQLRPPRTIVSM
jgi:hypothetical protein